MTTSLLEKWETLKDRSLSNVSIARGILFVLITLLVINAVSSIIKTPLIAIIFFIIYFPIYFFAKEDLTKDFSNLMKDEFSRKIDINTFNAELRLMVEEILSKFKIDEPIEYYISVNNFDYSPHVFSRSKINFLILPLGFFKLMSENKEEAKAILAHELSHIAQRDTDLTILLKIILKYVFIILLPIQLALFAPLLYYSYQSSREYREEAESYRTAMFGSGNSNSDYYQTQIAENYAHAQQNERIFYALLISIIILFLYYRFLRHITYNSERTADIGALVITNAAAVKSIFEKVLHDRKYKKRRSLWFTVNPSIKWRLEQLQSFEKRNIKI